MKDKALSVFSFFTSTGTLVCCALPVFLVTLGLGATVASAISAAPWLVTLSRHKEWIFLGAGVLLAVNLWLVYGEPWRQRRRAAACGLDPDSACRTAERFTGAVVSISVAVYLVGLAMAYLALPVRMLFEGG